MPLRRAPAASPAHSRLLRLVPRSRRTWRRVATVAGCVLAANIAYNIVFGQNGLISYEHKRSETAQLATEQHRLIRENDYLHEHVDRLRTDPSAIEHQAREELHYTRPGEVIYTLQNGPAAAPTTVAVTPQPTR